MQQDWSRHPARWGPYHHFSIVPAQGSLQSLQLFSESRQSFHVCHFSWQHTQAHAAALTHFTMQELINTLDETRKQVRAHGDQMQATRQELVRRLRSKEQEVLALQSFMPIVNETNLCCYILLFLGLC